MLEMKNINIQFHKKMLESELLSFPHQGLCVIKGKSGSGKTSLIRCLIMEDHFYDIYRYDDKEMTKELVEEKFSILNQNQEFIDELSIKDHIQLIEKLYSFDKKEEYIIKLKLEKLLSKYPNQLSGGEKTRVGLLLRIMKQTEILILDEPTASLDLFYTQIVLDILKDYAREHLVIVCTHDEEVINQAHILYEIKNNCIQTINNNEQVIENKRKKTLKYLIFPTLQMSINLKKKNKFYYIILYISLSFLILLSSFGLSLHMGTKVKSDSFESVYHDELLVYKSKFELTGGGYEYPITNDEFNVLKSIKHVKDIKKTYIYRGKGDIVVEEDDNSLNMIGEDSLYLSSYENNKKRINLKYDENGKYWGTLGYCSYNADYDYSKDIDIVLDNKEDGIYVSKALADLLEIKADGNEYQVEFCLMIPTHQIYGDAIIPYENEDGSYGPEGDPLLEWLGKKETVRLPVNGILKSSQMGIGINYHLSLFFPDQYIQEKIGKNKSNQSFTYYWSNEENCYKLVTSSYKGNDKIIDAKPYEPTVYRLKIDDLVYIEDIIKEIEDIGLKVIKGDYSKGIREYENNTDNMVMIISGILLIIVTLVYGVIKYLQKERDLQIKKFVESFGIRGTRGIIRKIYLVDFVLLNIFVIVLGIIYAAWIGPMMEYPIHFTYMFIPVSVILSIIVMFIVPLFVYRLRK